MVETEDTVSVVSHAIPATLPEEAGDMHRLDQPPSGHDATAVVCCQGCGRRYHSGCILSVTQQEPVSLTPFFGLISCCLVKILLPSITNLECALKLGMKSGT